MCVEPFKWLQDKKIVRVGQNKIEKHWLLMIKLLWKYPYGETLSMKLWTTNSTYQLILLLSGSILVLTDNNNKYNSDIVWRKGDRFAKVWYC